MGMARISALSFYLSITVLFLANLSRAADLPLAASSQKQHAEKAETVGDPAVVTDRSGKRIIVTGKTSARTPPSAKKPRKEAPANRLQGYLLNHAGMREASQLIADPRMAKLNAELRAALVNEHGVLKTARAALLPDARRLDADDARLLENAARLNETTRQLGVERADLARQISEHNAKCNPAPDEATYRWCVANAARLNGWRDDYNRRVATHNENVDRHNEAVSRHKASWDSFVAEIGKWEQRVSALIERVKKAFAQKTERCDYLARGTNGLCIYNCELTGVRYLMPDANGDCPTPINVPVEGPEGK